VADDILLDEHHSENLLRDKKWPYWNKAREAMYLVEQEEGETIFVWVSFSIANLSQQVH
jgi:hypothetical protein